MHNHWRSRSRKQRWSTLTNHNNTNYTSDQSSYSKSQVCHWLTTGRWFSPVSPTNTTDRHDITEIFLKVPLSTINQDQTNYRAKNRFNAITGAWLKFKKLQFRRPLKKNTTENRVKKKSKAKSVFLWFSSRIHL